MKQKRVVIIRNAAPYDFGGGERFPVFLANVLQDEGYSPYIISRSQSLLAFAESQNIPHTNGWWTKKQNWSGISNLLFPVYLLWQLLLTGYYLSVLIRLGGKVVHIQSKDDFIAATLAGHILKRRIIWTDHADLKHILLKTDRLFRNPSGKMVRWMMKYADVVTVVSKSEKELVSTHLSSSPRLIQKIHVVYNGAFDHFQARVTNTSNSNRVRLLFAGRIVRDKGIGETIEAVRNLHSSHSSIHLDVIGDGPDRDAYQAEANDCNFISFHGHQSDPSLWMQKADIFIQATYHEGFSLALVEASMMQLAIVSTDVGGNPEIIIDRTTGLLVPAQDPAALYTAIKELIDTPLLRQSLAKNAREQYLEKFQFDKIVKEQFIPLYEKNSH